MEAPTSNFLQVGDAAIDSSSSTSLSPALDPRTGTGSDRWQSGVSLKGNFDPEMQVDQLFELNNCWHLERMSGCSDAEKKSHFSLENDLNNKYRVC